MILEGAICKRGPAVSRIFFSNRLLQEPCDEEGREGRGRAFCRSHSLGRAWRRKTRFSTLEDEGVTITPPSSVSRTGFATGVIVLTIDPSMESSLTGPALKGGLIATENSVKTECERLLKELNRFKWKESSLRNLFWRWMPWWTKCLHNL